MYKELFMKYENVKALINGEPSYAHLESQLMRYCSEVYSVMVHENDFATYRNLPYSHYVVKDARFTELKLITDPDKRNRTEGKL